MGDPRKMFSATKTLNQFKNYDSVNDVQWRYDQSEKEHLFELYVAEYDTDIDDKIDSDYGQFVTSVSREKTTEGDKYYRVVVQGLFHDLSSGN